MRYGDSSMSRTVSLPAAIAARLILEGKIPQRGVLRPVHPEIYNPVLDELANLNIVCAEEKTVLLSPERDRRGANLKGEPDNGQEDAETGDQEPDLPGPGPDRRR